MELPILNLERCHQPVPDSCEFLIADKNLLPSSAISIDGGECLGESPDFVRCNSHSCLERTRFDHFDGLSKRALDHSKFLLVNRQRYSVACAIDDLHWCYPYSSWRNPTATRSLQRGRTGYWDITRSTCCTVSSEVSNPNSRACFRNACPPPIPCAMCPMSEFDRKTPRTHFPARSRTRSDPGMSLATLPTALHSLPTSQPNVAAPTTTPPQSPSVAATPCRRRRRSCRRSRSPGPPSRR